MTQRKIPPMPDRIVPIWRERLHGMLFGSIRRQLIFGVAAVHAVMMSLFVWDLAGRQQGFLIERQAEQAQILSESLALSAASALLADDVAGMQELVNAQAGHPGMVFVMLLDAKGRVMAHNQSERVGLFVSDIARLTGSIAPDGVASTRKSILLAKTVELVDSVMPVKANDRLIGWARVGIAQGEGAAKLQAVTRAGLIYTAVAVLIGALLATWMGRRMTAKLYAIRRVSEAVRHGQLDHRAPGLGGDEVGQLGRDFNHMLDALANREAELIRVKQALYEEKEMALVTLASIGDGVVTTDAEARVSFLNSVAERLTGWTQAEARGLRIEEVMRLVNEETRALAENPVERCRLEGSVVGMANHTVLIGRDGTEVAIEDSAAPIRDKDGRLIGVVMVFHDVSSQRAMTREMSWQLAHDGLTGLTNRREFERRLQALLACAAPGVAHALLFLDLDQFKIVNDTCGHLAGDELLKRLAEMLQEQVRGGDVLARLGGDEFAVLLENCPLDRARGIAEKLRQKVRDFEFFWQDKRFEVGVSIGVAPIDAAAGSIAEVTAAADMACYAAKERGRNRIHVHSPDDLDMERRRNELHAAGGIRSALEENRLVLFGQEIRSIRGDGQGHYEVLLRLRGEDGVLQAPALFIPAAERYGLMGEVDRWVVRNAFMFMAQHPKVHLAINLSGLSLQDENFSAYITQWLTQFNVDASHVCFEITETAAITHVGHAIAFIRDLKAWGFRFSLDDFGSGMSSFTYLKNLPVDFLKIDGAFVRDIVSDPIDRAFVETINRIGQVMGMETIAEFVESDEILRELMRIGVDYAQGYGIAKPVPLDTLNV
ncbi:MAG: hypothetical protein B7Y41_01680 [Hydrogenophilales bacterium 28-61-23]|nr:MAG: hypothetical protein B7Y41_01680 [Hydrogenophilales bacterium 28-61-23]